MKVIALFAFIAVTAASRLPFNPQLDEHWENFKRVYGKSYNGQEEFSKRLSWEQTVADIIDHNLKADMGLHTYRKGINEYADISHDEFVKHFNGFKSDGLKSRSGDAWVDPVYVHIPDTVDWRKQGLVTPIKNQQQCGSCWAFSTTGSLEGQHMKNTGKLVSLSEQNLVDCSGAEGNMGCEGGLMDQAFQYIKENKGIDTEASYPYTAEDGPKCLFKKNNVGATVTGYVDIPTGDEEALKKAVATVGPISVAIDASNWSFQTYQSGIYNEPACSSDQLDHGVLAIGYGTEDGNDYWLVKNSWGTTWGIQGYIKMTRNKNNQCGIATQASYPTV
ncbi:cathepsin L-like peptidase [Parasteatoda tepidariorum]|uniref:cathepsin L-like peptidase n=1 Tax=Parasteatoda tepidariorum TaxID=114398 RepID=UPI001C7296FA|nr:procathepsin L [Parasteatoda tepidariorum]XP_015917127.2 procathepsin L [Parasteatoda tepidariorum]